MEWKQTLVTSDRGYVFLKEREQIHGLKNEWIYNEQNILGYLKQSMRGRGNTFKTVVTWTIVNLDDAATLISNNG